MAKKQPVIKPLGDRVLLKELTEKEKEQTTASGIILPETVKKDTKGAKRAKVVAVGEGRREEGELIPVAVKEGDVVLFSWGEELTVDDEEYYIVSESNILAVIK